MKNVILTPNPYRDKNFQTVRSAVQILKEAGINPRLCLPFEVDRSYDLPKDLRFSRLDRELPNAEMVICFGGDGTILHMAKAATRKGIPILGVNIGTMGFMAELESTELDKLADLVKGKYTLDSRMMLDVTVQRDRDIIFHDICLNDVVVTKGAVARIVHLEVKCDGVRAIESGGDGIIVSTPTGSTAYSLSAGGPVVEPVSQTMMVTPICTHNMRFSSYVLSPDHILTVELERNGRKPVYLFVDESRAFALRSDDKIQVRRSKHVTRLVRLTEKSFCEIFAQKMLPGGM